MTLSIVPGDRKVHPDWASTLHISNDGQRLFTTAFGLTNLGTTFAVARAQGHLLCTVCDGALRPEADHWS